MKTAQEKLKGIVKGMVSAMIDGDSREWPPECGFILYQPSRPVAHRKKEESNLREQPDNKL